MNRENFTLPLNALKRETSYFDVLNFNNQDVITIGETDLYGFKFAVDKQVHRLNPKIKFYITGFRNIGQPTAYLVGHWVELENYQIYYSPQFETGFSAYPFHDGFMIEYNTIEDSTVYQCVLQLWSMQNIPCEIWIEKISIIDSDFNKNISWLHPDYEFNIRDILRPLPPTFPDITQPKRPIIDPNNPFIPISG
ncbi:MAG: hypothetical protein FWC41_00755 [Firmicutes bacterium]|nr:hypothetical protein [Bacillota bacterium]